MKAVICKAYGPTENLVLGDVEQLKPSPPFSSGAEAAGIVKEVGAGVERVKPKDRVIAFSAYGSFAARDPQHNQENLRDLLSWHQAGKLNPRISARYPLERAVDALNDILQRKVTGKTVLVV